MGKTTIRSSKPKQTKNFFSEKTFLSQKLLKAVEKWKEDKKCQGQSFLNNEADPDDTDEDDQYIFRQKLFSSIDKENSDIEYDMMISNSFFFFLFFFYKKIE